MPSGGDLKEITWKNSDVGQGRYFSQAKESHSLKLGGLLTDDSDTNIDTGGNFINLKSTDPWSYEATIVVDSINPNRLEQETAQALSNSFSDTTWTFQCIDGRTYTAVGSIVGEIKVDRSKTTFSFKAMGGGTAQAI